jgi:hypothetical protein
MNEDLKLFQFEKQPTSNMFVLPEEIKGKTCRTCEHRQRWQCGGSVIQYCGIRKSNRTENGLLKIKCKMKACYNYKEENDAE